MGVYLSEPITTKKTIKNSNKKLSFCCSEMQGGWRKNMEDAAIHEIQLADGNMLFGVFDGHGGPQVSQYVEKIFKSILLDEQSYKSGDYVTALDIAFKKTDQKIVSPEGSKKLKELRYKVATGNDTYGQLSDISNSTGCTANVVLITDKKIIVANAGDSRSVLCRSGKAVELSFDHKPQSPEQQKRIVNAGGCITMGRVNGGLNLTRSFGDFDYKGKKQLSYDKQMITCKPDIKQFIRQKSDQFILMGCDGIWQRYVENSQGLIDIVKAQLTKKKQLDKIVQDLLDLLLAKQTNQGIGCDNMTCILIKFT